jgi:hypothetical protein
MSKTYYVRPGASWRPSSGAYVAAGRDGTRFPYWTWQKPDPLPLEEAEALRQAALGMGCRSIDLQPAEE